MIKIDMKMPENCFDCPVCNEYLICGIPRNGSGFGGNDVSEFRQGKPNWCPLKENEPKKPEWRVGRAHCPECGELFPKKKDNQYIRFCSFCGQAVKWDD